MVCAREVGHHPSSTRQESESINAGLVTQAPDVALRGTKKATMRQSTILPGTAELYIYLTFFDAIVCG